MFKRTLAAAVLAFASFGALAAADANKATAAELDAIAGVGPTMAQRILDARKEGAFKDWADLTNRVKGIKGKTATKLSNAGLTVDGKAYTAPKAAPATAAATTAASAPKK